LKEADKDEKAVYEMYYEYSEALRTLVSHRVLAFNRGEKEDVLRIQLSAPEETIISYLEKSIIRQNGEQACVDLIKLAIEDSYKRLIAPSVEREMRNRLTEMAEDQAIHVFSENLRNLLLQPPLKGRTILA